MYRSFDLVLVEVVRVVGDDRRFGSGLDAVEFARLLRRLGVLDAEQLPDLVEEAPATALTPPGRCRRRGRSDRAAVRPRAG